MPEAASGDARALERRLTALQRSLHLHLAALYQPNRAWAVTAWEMERLAEEPLPGEYRETVRQLRQNLYAYIASLGAEWPAEEENSILLGGTYVEASKTLKALWLSLHLVEMRPLEARVEAVSPEALYTLLRSYVQLAAQLRRLKPIPFKLADRALETAAMTALVSGMVEPEHFLELDAATMVADMLWALTRFRRP